MALGYGLNYHLLDVETIAKAIPWSFKEADWQANIIVLDDFYYSDYNMLDVDTITDILESDFGLSLGNDFWYDSDGDDLIIGFYE